MGFLLVPFGFLPFTHVTCFFFFKIILLSKDEKGLGGAKTGKKFYYYKGTKQVLGRGWEETNLLSKDQWLWGMKGARWKYDDLGSSSALLSCLTLEESLPTLSYVLRGMGEKERGSSSPSRPVCQSTYTPTHSKAIWECDEPPLVPFFPAS